MSEEHDDSRPLPPEPPQEGECCEDGCGEACVWEQYHEARAEYARALAEWQARQPQDAVK